MIHKYKTISYGTHTLREEVLQGKWYGYPRCCIREYIRDNFSDYKDDTRLGRKLIGTGYIPCSKCNSKYSTQELVDNINKNRMTSTNFIFDWEEVKKATAYFKVII